jgi:hypothetical protein
VVTKVCNSSTREAKLEDQEFEASLGYVAKSYLKVIVKRREEKEESRGGGGRRKRRKRGGKGGEGGGGRKAEERHVDCGLGIVMLLFA